MASIGEQIIEARRARNMTQEALANEVHISRALVSHYECGRRVPDDETLKKLSEALGCTFEPEPAASLGAEPGPDGALAAEACPKPVEEGAPPSPEPRGKGAPLWAVLGAAAMAALCVVVSALLWRGHSRDPTVYRADDGTTCTVEQFRAETPREDGAAWLAIDKVLKIQTANGIDMWMYEFVANEMNGVGATVDSLQMCHFVGDSAHVQSFAGETLPDYGIEQEIAPNGVWRVSGGLPVQEKVSGAGLTLNVTDAIGKALSFHAYLDLAAR